MLEVGHAFGKKQLGLACKGPFLEKLKALPGFSPFLELFNPLDGSQVYSNVMEDLTFTLFRTMAGQSSGFHLDTVTISKADDHPFLQVLEENGVRPFATKGLKETHGLDALGIITGAEEDVGKPAKLVWSPVFPGDVIEYAHEVERRRTGNKAARGFSLDKAPSTLFSPPLASYFNVNQSNTVHGQTIKTGAKQTFCRLRCSWNGSRRECSSTCGC